MGLLAGGYAIGFILGVLVVDNTYGLSNLYPFIHLLVNITTCFSVFAYVYCRTHVQMVAGLARGPNEPVVHEYKANKMV